MSDLLGNPTESPLLDPTALRIPVGARHTTDKKPTPSSLTIRKPGPDEWVRVHSDPLFRWEGYRVYEKDKKYHLLIPSLYDQLESNVRRLFGEWDFYLTSVLNDDHIIWPLKYSDTDYFRTMHEAMQAAMTGWHQVQSNQHLKRYDYRSAQKDYSTPDWTGFQTEEEARALFTRTFRENLIDELDHEVLERLRGRK
jgi:hypothetical protein